MTVNAELLSGWRDGPTRQAIVEFVERICGADGSATVPIEERVAVFDNDGTLWCEKPMPIQLISSVAASCRWPKSNPSSGAPTVEGRLRSRLRLVGRSHDRALRG